MDLLHTWPEAYWSIALIWKSMCKVCFFICRRQVAPLNSDRSTAHSCGAQSIINVIWTLVESLILRWDPSASQWQLSLFSASMQTHCSQVICNSEWVTVALHCALLSIHWSVVLSVLFGYYMAGLATCETACSYNHAPVYSVTSFKAMYIGCMCV